MGSTEGKKDQEKKKKTEGIEELFGAGQWEKDHAGMWGGGTQDSHKTERPSTGEGDAVEGAIKKGDVVRDIKGGVWGGAVTGMSYGRGKGRSAGQEGQGGTSQFTSAETKGETGSIVGHSFLFCVP